MAELANIGLNRGLIYQSIKRFVICLTKTDSGTTNVISMSDAAEIANWQALFDTRSWDTDPSVKFVPTSLVREVVKEDTEPVFFEVEDYKVKMRNAVVDISFSFLDPEPGVLERMATYEDQSISVFPITEDNKALGIIDGTDLKPIPIKDGSLSVPNYNPRGYEEGSRNVVTMRLNSGSDMNSLGYVEIADADVFSDSDFYSLYDATMTETSGSPTTSGGTFTITLDDVDPSSPATTQNVTGVVYTEVLVKKQGAGSFVALAASGSISESANVYTINETDVFATGDNVIHVNKDGYNVAELTVTVSA
jgi:hypothetical protein